MPKSARKISARQTSASPAASGPVAMEDWGASVMRPDAKGRMVEIGARREDDRRLENVPDDANGRKRVRRLHILEAMFLRRMIDQPQTLAGLRLAAAWEETQRSPVQGIVQDRVDGSPKPDARSLIMIIHQDRFASLIRVIPQDALPVVRHVCCEGRALRELHGGRAHGNAVETLRMGLEILARHLGLAA